MVAKRQRGESESAGNPARTFFLTTCRVPAIIGAGPSARWWAVPTLLVVQNADQWCDVKEVNHAVKIDIRFDLIRSSG